MSGPTGPPTVQGSGPPLVLVHGTAGSRSAFGTLPWHLRDRFQVARYDRRGTGTWPLPPDAPTPSVERHAADLLDVLRSLGGQRVVVFGTSFGASVVLEMLRTRPPEVAGAILHEPAILAVGGLETGTSAPVAREFQSLSAAGREREAALRFLARLGAPGVAEAERGASRDAPHGGAPDWRSVHRDLVAAIGWNPRLDELRDLDVPLLLLESERSAPATRASIESLARILRGSTRAIVPGAGHVLAGDDAWRRVAALVGPFAEACLRG